MELSYDFGFNTGSQFNGNISGIKWRSMGDGDYRSYVSTQAIPFKKILSRYYLLNDFIFPVLG
jgi:hypothetical protein